MLFNLKMDDLESMKGDALALIESADGQLTDDVRVKFLKAVDQRANNILQLAAQ